MKSTNSYKGGSTVVDQILYGHKNLRLYKFAAAAAAVYIVYGDDV